MASEGLVLYEFISGDNYSVLSERQSENAIEYIRKYNKELSLVSFKNEVLLMINYWDKAKSIDFIVNEFHDFLSELELEILDKKIPTVLYKSLPIWECGLKQSLWQVMEVLFLHL